VNVTKLRLIHPDGHLLPETTGDLGVLYSDNRSEWQYSFWHTYPEGGGSMPQSDAAMREIAKVMRRHVDQETIEKIVDELFEIRGDKSS
jgi:hypothetical protein